MSIYLLLQTLAGSLGVHLWEFSKAAGFLVCSFTGNMLLPGCSWIFVEMCRITYFAELLRVTALVMSLLSGSNFLVT